MGTGSRVFSTMGSEQPCPPPRRVRTSTTQTIVHRVVRRPMTITSLHVARAATLRRYRSIDDLSIFMTAEISH